MMYVALRLITSKMLTSPSASGTGSLGGPCQNVLFEDCVAQNITNDGGLIPSNGPFVRTGGFTMQGGTNQVKFVNCTAENVTATIGRVMGFGTQLPL